MKLRLQVALAANLILFSLSLFAAPEPSRHYQRFDHLKAAEKQKWDLQSKATIPLHFMGGLRCTAVYVGPSGEALTNLHCLESCITNLGLKTERPIREGVSAVAISDPLAVRCPVKFGTGLIEGELQLIKIFGPGWLSPREKLNDWLSTKPSLLLSLFNKGFEASGDLVLVKLPVHESSCVPISHTKIGAKVKSIFAFNIAYPVFIRRINPVESLMGLGTKAFSTYGQISGDPATVVGALAGNTLSKIPEFLMPSRVVMSSVDSEPGASGSPVFGENGEVIAITRSYWKADNSGYQPWTTQAIDLATFADEIESSIPQLGRCGG